MSTEAEVIAATQGGPVTAARLSGDLRVLGLGAGDRLLAHSSLSRLGFVPGGAQAVVEALLAVVGPAGLIVMPSFSAGLSEPANWSSPPVPPDWLDEVREALPAFDAALTPTRDMGVIAE